MTIVNDILKQMPGLGLPQRKFLAMLFVTILVLRARVNFRNLSRYCDYSERTIARQFREPFDWPAFHQRVLRMALDARSELVSAHDASFIPKSGKHTFGLGHFCNGCASRAERGLEISTLAVVDVTRRCAFTLAVSQTPPGEAATQAEPEDTRVDFYTQQLREHRHRLPPGITYHCVDGYYAKKKYPGSKANMATTSWLLATFGDSGLLKQICHERGEGGKVEAPCESMEKRAIFSRSAGLSAGFHQKRARAEWHEVKPPCLVYQTVTALSAGASGIRQSRGRRHDGAGLSRVPSTQRADARDMRCHNP
jgi:hypothetical protein